MSEFISSVLASPLARMVPGGGVSPFSVVGSFKDKPMTHKLRADETSLCLENQLECPTTRNVCYAKLMGANGMHGDVWISERFFDEPGSIIAQMDLLKDWIDLLEHEYQEVHARAIGMQHE